MLENLNPRLNFNRDDSLKATSMGDVQSNSLVRNSQIINSSIIINVFVSSKNDTEMIPSFVFPIEVSDDNIDPFWDASDNNKSDYQKVDTGLLMLGKEIGDRYYRPNPVEESTTEADA